MNIAFWEKTFSCHSSFSFSSLIEGLSLSVSFQLSFSLSPDTLISLLI